MSGVQRPRGSLQREWNRLSICSCIDYIPVATSKEPCHTPFLQVMKLYSMKSEVRYSPNMILFKLVGSFTVSQVSGIANYMYIYMYM